VRNLLPFSVDGGIMKSAIFLLCTPLDFCLALLTLAFGLVPLVLLSVISVWLVSLCVVDCVSVCRV
jgi:hypothetical protein